jgi:hypothetical protein
MCDRRLFAGLVITVVLGNAAHGFADDAEVERLINQLVDVAEPGLGYSPTVSGGGFLPYQDTDHIGTLILGGMRPERSETLRKIVELGAEAAPMLLKHIGDNRRCKMKPVSGFQWMRFSDEYDYNRRTIEKAPEGVNSGDREFSDNQPDKHAVTVGDLCFVALGQIVNRSFSATRYQPSGGMIVNSPSYTPALRMAVLAEWGGLTKERHRERLKEDFIRADHEYRRSGAYLRLAFYYPDAVEALVLEELAVPTYDTMDVWHLCRDVLDKALDQDDRRRKFEEFVREKGPVAADGVKKQLFDDLQRQERDEALGIHDPSGYSKQPKVLLSELFGQPVGVRASDRPPGLPREKAERARFIQVLTHDKSAKIAAEVRRLFTENENNRSFSAACLCSLANREQSTFLVGQLERVDVASPDTNELHLEWIKAIATSNDPSVRQKLEQIAKTTKNVDYFVAALTAVANDQDAKVLELAKTLLAVLPGDTKKGLEILTMIRDKFPNEAPEIYRSFLRDDSAQRIETMCRVLWHGNPLSKAILAKYLDDKRELSGFSIPMRVCDRVAQAISHTTDGQIKYDAEWSMAEREAQIEKLKSYCRER